MISEEVCMSSPKEKARKGKKHGCSRFFGCLTFFVLLLILLLASCMMLMLIRPVAAAGQYPLAVWLLIDNSNSMFEKDGIGSDPDLLRLDAARLFLSYLGVDERDLTHQAGVIFFGTEAETAVPLTPLTNDHSRATLFAQIDDPPRMGWTDPLAALQLAQAELEAVSGQTHPAIILLTDGKPEKPESMTTAEKTAYKAALQAQSSWFTDQGIPLFVVLLSNHTTDQDEEIANIWRPLWRDMSAAAPPGRFYVARTARDLPHIYHDIVVALTQEQTAGVVLEAEISEEGAETTLTIPDNLTQLTLVISKSDPAQEVVIETEDGQDVTATSPQIRRAGNSDTSAEEVWVIEQPPAGTWQVRVNGAGDITIWQDYKLRPATATPPPSPTSQSTAILVLESVATHPPTETSTATATLTPTAETSALSATETAVITLVTPSAPSQLQVTKPKPFNWPLLLLFGLFLAVVVTIIWMWWYRSRQPRVSGTIRVLSGGQLVRTIDLDSLEKTAVSLGKPPADIPLTGAETTVTIVPGAKLEDIRQMFIRSEDDITVNACTERGRSSRLAPTSAPLTDAAHINLGGGIQLRYENLRLRRAGRLSATDVKRKKIGEIRN